jgi:hypothetical protein
MPPDEVEKLLRSYLEEGPATGTRMRTSDRPRGTTQVFRRPPRSHRPGAPPAPASRSGPPPRILVLQADGQTWSVEPGDHGEAEILPTLRAAVARACAIAADVGDAMILVFDPPGVTQLRCTGGRVVSTERRDPP